MQRAEEPRSFAWAGPKVSRFPFGAGGTENLAPPVGFAEQVGADPALGAAGSAHCFE